MSSTPLWSWNMAATILWMMVSSRVSSGLCLVLLCGVCYWNSLPGDLVHDDIFAIKDNADVRPDTPLSTLVTNDFWGKPMSDPTSHKSYRPLCVLTFRLNYMLHGLEPWGYHAFNVLLHTLCTLLFWCLCRCVVFRSNIVGTDSSLLSWQAAALFAVHPIHTEAVAGVVGRADILACILFQVSLLCYYHCICCESLCRSTLYLLVSVFAGAAAMFCKEHGITVFGVCFLLEMCLLSQGRVQRVLKDIQQHIPALLRMTIIVIATCSLVAFRVKMLHGHLPHFSAQDNPASFANSSLTRALTYMYLYYFNAKLLVAPVTLCYDWQMGSIPVVEAISDMRNIGTVAFFCYLFTLCWVALASNSKRNKYLTFFSICLLVVPFLPASNLFLRIGFVVAERILYIPSMGYCILLVHGLHHLCKALHGHTDMLRRTVTLVLLLIVCLYAGRSIVRNTVWHSRESLFKSGVETLRNNAKAHYNYANFLKDMDRKDAAISHYTAALSLAPDHASSHNNLGTLLSGEQAEHHFREAVRHNPQHSRAFYNLGNNLRDQGKAGEAETALRNSLRIDPKYTDAMMSLANMLSMHGNTHDDIQALQLLKQAAQLKPLDSNALNNYAALLSKLGHHNDSISAYEQALMLSPDHHIALAGLARVLRRVGQTERAEELFKRSLSIKEEAGTFLSLGGLYFNTGRTLVAKEMFSKALQMEPTRVDIICSYSQTLSHLGDAPKAIKDLNQALQQQPSAPCIHLHLASNYAKLHQLEKAVKHSGAAIAYSVERNDRVEAYQLHGTLLKDLNKLPQAAESFQKAVELSPQMVSALMNLGAVFHLMGNYTGAEHYYTTALELDPNNTILQQNLQKLQRLQRSSSSKER